MPTVENKTPRPLRLNLPGGKTLHLAPRGTGQIAPEAAAAPSVLKLVEAGDIEVDASDAPRRGRHAKDGKFQENRPGHHASRGSGSKGDR